METNAAGPLISLAYPCSMNPTPRIRRNGTAAHSGCMRRSNMAHLLSNRLIVCTAKEVFHRRGNFHDVCLNCEMACIEELDLRVRQVFSKRLGSRRNEEGIIHSPDRK